MIVSNEGEEISLVEDGISVFGEFAGLPITSGIYTIKVTMILKVD
jgi:hypothetical protein